jgi:hypothetical protein
MKNLLAVALISGAFILVVGCGSDKKPAASTEVKDAAAAPAAVSDQAKAVTSSDKPAVETPVAGSAKSTAPAVPAVEKAGTPATTSTKPAPYGVGTKAPYGIGPAASPGTAGDTISDASIKNWMGAIGDFQKLGAKMDKTNTASDPNGAAAMAMATSTEKDASNIATKYGFKDMNEFGEVSKRIMAGTLYIAMKQSLDTALKDMPADQKAMVMAAMGTQSKQIEQFKQQVTQLGVTDKDLNVIARNLPTIQKFLDADSGKAEE